MNDRDEKYENPEESEYHFSDDDVSYEEVDTETQKPAVVPEPKESIFSRMSRSKRMLIVGGVFVVLLFVVYKMVTPSAPVPSTDITPNIATTTTTTVKPVVRPRTPTLTERAPLPTQTITVATTPSPARPETQPVVTANSPNVQLPNLQQAPTEAVKTAQPTTLTPQQIMNQQQQALVAPPAMMQPTTAMPAPSQPIVSQQIPSQVPVNQMVTATPAVTPNAPNASGIDAGIATMAATNEKLITQLQSEYAQKVNDYSSQSKAMQEQLQSLNTRVAGLESQLNQLIQTLNRQTAPPPAPTVSAPPQAAPPAAHEVTPEPRLGYNVQAIIPGRAWLRSDSGDTITVAEGDVIKDVGRVTKIDPYDGIVEINTGTHTVSLSYGAGG